MIEDNLENNEELNEITKVIPISGMYQNWFLDYASYVILERAVPYILDGLKPVQRRILHSLKELDDGRYHKVANLIGNTMKYHPHGDASIGDALVKLGQKGLLIDMQGNWGNVSTGDKAAAARYIEARLSHFALDVCYSPKVTKWKTSYDGRANEPDYLPIKFPLLLFQGVEGIAVGLSTKILPHNFNELIDASISILNGRNKKIKPDFQSGGLADFSNYNDGKKGGKVRVRAKIEEIDKKTLNISELPYNVTTTTLIDSILRANDKGKIKIKNIQNNTADKVDIVITIANDVSIDKTIDALYAFTDCEISVYPVTCVIQNDTPIFTDISNILKISTENTKLILTQELEIKLNELNEKWHSATLERIFIEEKIYRDIEDVDSWQGIIDVIFQGLKPFVNILKRKVTIEDVERLTEIKIKRISKYDLNKENEKVKLIEDSIKDVQNNLDNITIYSIQYFKKIKEKYGKGRERKTKERIFDTIEASKVALANKKLYANKTEGFIGTSMRKDEYILECSDIDDIIVFKKDGTMLVTKVSSKIFVGKDIIHIDVFKKNDLRTTYNMIYRDKSSNKTYLKRFPVKGVTRNKDYNLGSKSGTDVIYFSANPNGEAELVSLILRAKARLKKLKFDVDFSEFDIKSRGVRGNLICKHYVRKIELKNEGVSTLAAKKIWYDESVKRLNDLGHGSLLGEFSGDDKIILISELGYFNLLSYDLSNHFPENIKILEKYDPDSVLTCIYYNSINKLHYIKRFNPKNTNRKLYYLSENKGLDLKFIFFDNKKVKLNFKKGKNGKTKESIEILPSDFISIKGYEAIGKQLSQYKLKSVELVDIDIKKNIPPPEDLENKDQDFNNSNGQIMLDFNQ